MKLLLALTAAVVVGGCVEPVGKMSAGEVMWGEPVRPITLPDGKPGFIVSCDRGPEYCFERARQTCGGNYDILRRSESTETDRRTMEISCKQP